MLNIIKIIDKDGANVVKYYYNSFGVVTSNIISVNEDDCTFLQYNPFIYKEYYYDKETGLFIMGQRYYSPELCRFIQPDSIEYLDPSSINGLNLYCYCFNNPIMYADPSGHKPEWSQILTWVGAGILAASIVVLSIYTAGAILAAAPALANFLSASAIAYTGIVGLGSAAATAVSIGAGVLAVGTIAIGVNEGISVISGRNFGAELLGYELYNGVAMTIGMFGSFYMMAGSVLPSPSTGNIGSNLNEQLAIDEAYSNPNNGHVMQKGKPMQDPRMPYWLGWRKYYYNTNNIEVHYVGNRLFPKWWPYAPWIDFKVK